MILTAPCLGHHLYRKKGFSGKSKGDDNIVKLTPDLLMLRLLQGFQALGERVDPNEALGEMRKLILASKRDPAAARDLRADNRHHRRIREREDPYYRDFRIYLKNLSRKYGPNSLTFQTMLEAVSCVTLSFRKVADQYKRHPVPPAFDPSKRSPLSKSDSDEGKKLREEIFEWIQSTDDPVIQETRKVLDVYNPIWKDPESRDYFLTRNGSSNGIEFLGVPTLDIESQCLRVPDLIDEYPFICRFFGIKNCSSGDHYIYLDIPNPWKGAAGIHTVVPDKDGKMREVYFMIARLQAIGKGIAERLTPGLRRTHGIYTYRQRDLVQMILDRGWASTRTIITIDMEKFSDTIVRKYLMELLVHLGLPKSVANELDEFYGLPVFDKITQRNLGSHDVVMQGHYGIFALMSILNLCIQRFLNYRYNVVLKGESIQSTIDYSAVLGDDTCMVFHPSINPSAILPVIKKYYGSFGMRINDLKSDSIYLGHGQADFAKIHFTKDGIIDHMNPKNIYNLNIDGVIKDIMALSRGYSDKNILLSFLFGQEAADRIMNLHVINGGTADRPISEKDLNYYMANLSRVNMVIQEEKHPQEELSLTQIASEYRKMGYSLQDSPLVNYLDPDDMLPNDLDEADDLIMTRVLNAKRIGSDIKQSILSLAIGHTWEEICSAFESFRRTKKYSTLVTVYEEFSKFDSFIAKRKMGKKGRYSSIYQPCITGTVSQMECYSPSDDQIREETSIKTLHDYYEQVPKYRSKSIWKSFDSIGIRLEHRYYGRKLCCWIWDLDENKRFALHDVNDQYYPDSVAPYITDAFYKEKILPKLQMIGLGVSKYQFCSFVMDLITRD